jgi:hypothetical protein
MCGLCGVNRAAEIVTLREFAARRRQVPRLTGISTPSAIKSVFRQMNRGANHRCVPDFRGALEDQLLRNFDPVNRKVGKIAER